MAAELGNDWNELEKETLLIYSTAWKWKRRKIIRSLSYEREKEKERKKEKEIEDVFSYLDKHKTSPRDGFLTH